MGLLDGMSNEDGLLMGLALMAAGSPKAQRTGLGEGLLGAFQAGRANQTAREDRTFKQQLQQAQMADYQAQAAQRQAAAAQAQQAAARQAAFQRGLMGGATSPQQALAGGGGPTQANAAQIGQQQGPDFRALAMQFPEQADLLHKLANAGDWGRRKVARVEETMVNGRPVKQQYDEFGGSIGDPLAQWKAPVHVDTGGGIQFVDPVTMARLGMLGKTNSPDALLSAATTRRGQDMTDARSREKNAIDASAVGKVEWKQDVNGNFIGLPKEVSGQGPVTPIPVNAPGKREQQARNALDIISEAEKLIDKGTGSYLGMAGNQIGRAFGVATDRSVADGQLKALEGALMMAQPRMEGPQSDKDTALYRQMAAQIGDPTVPAPVKRAALGVVKSLHQKYVPGAASGPAQAGGAPQVINFGDLK